MSKTVRQQQAENTKRRIFDAATQLLTEQDFESLTIRDIVHRAEVSIGTFYHYYDTKIDVFYETYQVADEYFEDTVAPMTAGPDTLSNLRIFFEQYAIYNAELTDYRLTRLLYLPDNRYFNRPRTKGMVRVLADILQRGVQQGDLVCDSSIDDMCDYFMISMRGLVYNWCTADRAYDLKARMASFLERLVKAFL